MTTVLLDYETQGKGVQIAMPEHNWSPLLIEMFEQVEQPMRDDATKRYAQMAVATVAGYVKTLIEMENDEKSNYHRLQRPQFMKWVGVASITGSKAGYIEAAKNGVFQPDLDAATKAANAMVDNAKLAFVHKLSKKLKNALKLCTGKPAAEGKLRIDNGRITGYLKVTLPTASFQIDMGIITNHRSGRYGGVTWFNQFPARFVTIRMGETTKNSASEAWMADNFKDTA